MKGQHAGLCTYVHGQSETEGEEVSCTIQLPLGRKQIGEGHRELDSGRVCFFSWVRGTKACVLLSFMPYMEIYLTNKCSVPGTVLSALEIISLLTLTIFYGHEIIQNEIKGDTVGHSYELKR